MVPLVRLCRLFRRPARRVGLDDRHPAAFRTGAVGHAAAGPTRRTRQTRPLAHGLRTHSSHRRGKRSPGQRLPDTSSRRLSHLDRPPELSLASNPAAFSARAGRQPDLAAGITVASSAHQPWPGLEPAAGGVTLAARPDRHRGVVPRVRLHDGTASRKDSSPREQLGCPHAGKRGGAGTD